MRRPQPHADEGKLFYFNFPGRDLHVACAGLTLMKRWTHVALAYRRSPCAGGRGSGGQSSREAREADLEWGSSHFVDRSDG